MVQLPFSVITQVRGVQALEHHCLVAADVVAAGVAIHHVGEGAGVDAVTDDIRHAVGEIDVVLDEVPHVTPHVSALGVEPSPRAARSASRRRELPGDRRREPRCERDVAGRERAEHHRVVRGIQSRREVAAGAGRTGVAADGLVRVADVAVAADLRFVVPPSVVAVGDVDEMFAFSVDVVAEREARHAAYRYRRRRSRRWQSLRTRS